MTSKWITNRPPTIDEVPNGYLCWADDGLKADGSVRIDTYPAEWVRADWRQGRPSSSTKWALIDPANPDTPPSDEPANEWITKKPATRKAAWVFALTIDGAINVMHHNAAANAWHDNFNGNVFAYLEIEKPEAPNLTPPSRTGDYWIGSDGTVTTVEPDESEKRYFTHVKEVEYEPGAIGLIEREDDELHDPPEGMYPHEPGTLIQYEYKDGTLGACAVITSGDAGRGVNAWLTHHGSGEPWSRPVCNSRTYQYRITGFDPSRIPEHLRVDHKKGAAVLLRSVAESLRKGIKPYPSTLENIAAILEEGETT